MIIFSTFVHNMKKTFLIILVLFLLCSLATKEQVILSRNMVNNPCFEEYYGCPANAAQLINAPFV